MKLHAVLVGINRYQDARISALQYAASDAERFYGQLASSLAAEDLSLQLLIDEQATRKAIITVIGEHLPRLASREDVILLYFAGHGSPETSEAPDRFSRYLIAHDTEYDAIFATGLELEYDLIRLLQRLPARLVVVILDTCFSGRAGGRTFEGPLLRTRRTELRGPVAFAPGLQDLPLGEGRIILAACDDDEVAGEDEGLRQGIFTYFLLQALSGPEASVPASGPGCNEPEERTISLSTLYDRVAMAVVTFTRGRQHPVLNGRLSLARLPLLRSPER
ncbi:caspase family protein [Thermogemmatispora carboxidivorans]|uniref:caspase family protein n=1 Tax=Thermogemmatispora carboxidivorans TaxID=1382306 RepID=UPI00069AD437|nr:caspase family protein [Thermogemmatispora carboxidivorans]